MGAPVGGTYRVGPGFWVGNEARTASVGQGDSGGPVAAPNGTDTSRVVARGVISAIDPNALGSCTGMTQDGRQCAWRSFHVNIEDALRGLGLTIKTN